MRVIFAGTPEFARVALERLTRLERLWKSPGKPSETVSPRRRPANLM